ncbi:alpha/beta fold hydrolase [Marinilactibacillus kalidii]|uniref:alpha/beta fold hydrolase n=1 Tax=Marinilactibacillus kalidii TaxID=2820274 RepID=UPI001ABDD345|nr:alpha/beta hydrolase [Marinilactibacillus kalidii]
MLESYITTETFTLSLDKAGEGEVILLLHAGIVDRRMWENEMQYLKKQACVINIDLPGYGNSEITGQTIDYVQVIASVIEHFQLKKVTIMAASFGGKVALDYALLYPEKIERLMLVSPAVSGWTDSMELSDYEEIEESLDDSASLLGLIDQFWFVRNRPLEQIRHHHSFIRRMIKDNLSLINDEVEECSLVENSLQQLNQLTMPMLIINGAKDVPDFLEIGEQIHKSAQATERIIFPDATHLPNLDDPIRFKESLLIFLGKN